MSQTADTSCPRFPPVAPPIAARLILLEGVCNLPLLSIYALFRQHRLDTSSPQGAGFWLQRRRTSLQSKQQQCSRAPITEPVDLTPECPTFFPILWCLHERLPNNLNYVVVLLLHTSHTVIGHSWVLRYSICTKKSQNSTETWKPGFLEYQPLDIYGHLTRLTTAPPLSPSWPHPITLTCLSRL